MDESLVTDLLEELLEGFGVRIRYEVIKQDEDASYVEGGLCLLRRNYVLIVNSNAPARDRIITLARALKHFNLDQIYLLPVLRELLDRIPEQRPFKMGINHGAKVEDPS